MPSLAKLPSDLQKYVKSLGRPVTSEEVDLHSRLQSIRDRTYRFRTIIKAWNDQQSEDRRMRTTYATSLLIALGVQMFLVNVIYVLMGCAVLHFEPWTANTFVMGVFAEVAALVWVVVRYLFAPPGEKVLELIERLKAGDE